MVEPECDRPPKGWFCRKVLGHEGPCPTQPKLWMKVWLRLHGFKY